LPTNCLLCMTHAGPAVSDGDHITGVWCYIAINERAVVTAKGTDKKSK